MRRVGRYIFNALTVLSLLLCVATVGLWVRSYIASDQIWLYLTGYARSDADYDAHEYWGVSSKGRTRWDFNEVNDRNPPSEDLTTPEKVRSSGLDYFTSAPRSLEVQAGRTEPEYHLRQEFFGFVKGEEYYDGNHVSSHFRYVAMPDWAFAIPLAVIPLLWLLRWRRNRLRRRSGYCYTCSYDLRATPDRCPECATVPAVEA